MPAPTYLPPLAALLGGTVAAPGEQNGTALWPTAAGALTSTAPAPATVVLAAASPPRATLRAAPLAHVLIGEEATVRGVVPLVRRVLFHPAVTVPDAVRKCADEVLAAALYRVATEITFGAAAPLTTAEADCHWTVGTLFPLPAWAVDSGGTRTWHVDVDRVAAAVTAVAAVPLSAEPAAATLPARVLHRADASASAVPIAGSVAFTAAYRGREKLRTDVASPTYAAAAEGRRLAAEARWNPYAVLFALLELSIALDGVAPSSVAPFAETFWSALTAPERAIVGATSAGHVWLRRLWTWWGRAAGTVDLRAALGLTVDDLAARAPGVVGDLEPPLRGQPALPTPSAATVGTKKKPYPLPIVAFGRRVPFIGTGYPRSAPRYFGISHPGAVLTAQYLVPPAGDPDPRPFDMSLVPGADKARTLAQWGRILTAIGGAEGQLDGASAFDGGMCSLGFQQWSMHSADQGPVLLDRLKNLSGVYYDAVVRALGLETGRNDDPGKAPSAAGATVADLDASVCFFTLTALGRTRYAAPQTDADLDVIRKDVFEWTPSNGQWSAGKRAMLLAARWSVAARYGIELWRAEAELGVAQILRAARFTRTPDETTQWTDVLTLAGIPEAAPGRPATVVEMFGTEALLALVVDMAVNTPLHVGAAMRRAVARAVAVAGQDGLRTAPPPPLDNRFLVLLAKEFLTERYYFGQKKKGQPVQTRRADAIDVAPERVRVLLNAIGTLHDLPARPVDGKVAAMLTSFGIHQAQAASLTSPAVWP